MLQKSRTSCRAPTEHATLLRYSGEPFTSRLVGRVTLRDRLNILLFLLGEGRQVRRLHYIRLALKLDDNALL